MRLSYRQQQSVRKLTFLDIPWITPRLEHRRGYAASCPQQGHSHILPEPVLGRVELQVLLDGREAGAGALLEARDGPFREVAVRHVAWGRVGRGGRQQNGCVEKRVLQKKNFFFFC